MIKPVRLVIKKYKHLNKRQRRSIVLASSLSLVLLFVGLWSLSFNGSSSQELAKSDESAPVGDLETAPAMGAIVSYKEGVVEVKNELGEWSDATTDTTLVTGMGIRTTGAASRAIVLLDDGSAIRLDANTEATFDSLTLSKVSISQESGYLYNRVVKSDSRSYVVHSENAQYQSVGTAFRTIATGDEEAVEVYQNSIKETSTNLSAKEGEKLIIKNENDPSKNETKESIDIEKIKEDAFIKWNREQDQKDPNFKSNLGFLGDFDGPKIEISEPTDGTSIEVPADQVRGSVTIKGKTEAGATMTVQSKSLSGSAAQTINVQSDGNFDTGIIEAPIGTSIFEFIATDKKGNKTTQTITYTLKRKTTTQEKGIVLSIDSSDSEKIQLSWGLVGISTPDGVKILVSETENASYPDNSQEYIKTGATAELKKSDFNKEKTYYISVCRYSKTTDSCDVYSNEVQVKLED